MRLPWQGVTVLPQSDVRAILHFVQVFLLPCAVDRPIVSTPWPRVASAPSALLSFAPLVRRAASHSLTTTRPSPARGAPPHRAASEASPGDVRLRRSSPERGGVLWLGRKGVLTRRCTGPRAWRCCLAWASATILRYVRSSARPGPVILNVMPTHRAFKNCQPESPCVPASCS